MKRLATIALLTLILSGCTDWQRAKTWQSFSHHKVTMYSQDGTVIKTWTATTNPSYEGDQACHFLNEDGLLVNVCGTFTVEQLK